MCSIGKNFPTPQFSVHLEARISLRLAELLANRQTPTLGRSTSRSPAEPRDICKCRCESYFKMNRRTFLPLAGETVPPNYSDGSVIIEVDQLLSFPLACATTAVRGVRRRLLAVQNVCTVRCLR